MNEKEYKHLPKNKLTSIETNWDKAPKDHFGYASDEERLAKRGLEDWEMVDAIPESQKPVPKWFIGVVLVVLLVAIGLSFPFWGVRPGQERAWLDWGFGIALVYIAVMSVFVHFMVKMYGSRVGGRLDSDSDSAEAKRKESPTPKNDA